MSENHGEIINFLKVTVDISEKDLKDIFNFSKERKKGPAISKFITSSLMLRRREEFCNQVMKGTVRVDFPTWETTRLAERKATIWTS